MLTVHEMSVVHTSSIKSQKGFTNVQTLRDALISSKNRLIQKRESAKSMVSKN